MQKLSPSSGGGLAAFGIKNIGPNAFKTKAVTTSIAGEPPFIVRAGLGGPQYLRHVLESAVLNRGGHWHPNTALNAINYLEIFDSLLVKEAYFEEHIYRQVNDDVEKIEERDWSVARSQEFLGMADLEPVRVSWRDAFSHTTGFQLEELDDQNFLRLWVSRADDELRDFHDSNHGLIGKASTALLNQQAYWERKFFVNTLQAGAFDTDAFKRMVGLRYNRLLILLHLQKSNYALPLNIADVARTLMLVCSSGAVHEARMIAKRCAPLFSNFVLAPYLAHWIFDLLLGGTRFTHLFTERFGTSYESKLGLSIFDAIGAKQTDQLSMHLNDFALRRKRGLSGFGDEFISDFDDDVSWYLAYEVGALFAVAELNGSEFPDLDDGFFKLPTNDFCAATSVRDLSAGNDIARLCIHQNITADSVH